MVLSSSRELLETARRNAYAIGAFNIYNLEGVKAVVNAAEASNSPAMLQLHPSALTYGKLPLVALCLEAARSARVPIAVHLDHSTSNRDLDLALQVGPIEEVEEIVRSQHPKPQEPARDIAPADFRAIIQEHFPSNLTPDEMRQQGINEWILGPSDAQMAQLNQLLAWLDRQITTELNQPEWCPKTLSGKEIDNDQYNHDHPGA